MNSTKFISLLVVIISIFSLSGTRTVLAHGGEPRLEISVERVNPGGVVDVRGVDFEREETITLVLVNSSTAIRLGEIIADVEGTFLQTVTLPVDLAEGTYNFLALAYDHNITSPDLVVTGPPVLAEEAEGQGQRGQEEGLLAPIPTFAPGVVVPHALPAATVAAPETIKAHALDSPVLFVTGIVFVLAVILFVSQRRKN